MTVQEQLQFSLGVGLGELDKINFLNFAVLFSGFTSFFFIIRFPFSL